MRGYSFFSDPTLEARQKMLTVAFKNDLNVALIDGVYKDICKACLNQWDEDEFRVAPE